MTRDDDVRMLTMSGLERAKREPQADLGLITPHSAVHVPIRAHMQVIDMAELSLASLPNAPFYGRLLVQRSLRAWGIAHMIDDAQLVASELLTNAVNASAGLTTIQVRLAVLEGTSLMIEVRDCSPEPPVLDDAVSHNESGRGLMIVEALSECWGYYHPTYRSKAVWAELLIPLPAREHEHPDMPPVTAMDDPRVLHRVHTGLKNL
jgi:hypothetical protein